MSEATQLAAAVNHEDPIVGLRAVAALRRLLESIEALQVQSAREQQWSWQQIADAMGVTKQAVHKKHGETRAFGRPATGRSATPPRARGRGRAGASPAGWSG